MSIDIGIKNDNQEKIDLLGLGERCQGEVSLGDTIDGAPYRLWTADQFDASRPRASTYGISPILMAKRQSLNKERSQMIDALFFANASDTFVDIFSAPHQDEKTAHWMFESGSMTFFILTSSNAFTYHKKLSLLTGPPVLPALWTLGYH